MRDGSEGAFFMPFSYLNNPQETSTPHVAWCREYYEANKRHKHQSSSRRLLSGDG